MDGPDTVMDPAGVRAALDRAAATAPMPAVAITVVDRNGVVARLVRGAANLRTREPVTEEYWWDLASLTKVLVTLPAVLDLVAEHRLRLDDRLGDVWPAAAGSPYDYGTIAQLLSYNAGAPASRPLFQMAPAAREDIIAAALAVPLTRPAGTGGLYSDIGMLLLGEAAAHITGSGLDRLAMSRGWCRFGPLPGRAVATEQCPWRGRLIVGEVHDENAAALDGVAGHAGAFATVDMVAEAARAWVTGGAFLPAVAQAATRCWSTGPLGERFGLGFRLAGPASLGGAMVGPGSFGASGFVGNLLWVEPSRGYAITILGNRVHPRRGPREPFARWCDRLLADIALAWQRS